ncbi:MAG: LysM peptidoglycan-binding protein [Gammaproteobacteria bacterium]|nr:LysM peptidoglycan-binding protein [Gammaproteobacteria bacterium]
MRKVAYLFIGIASFNLFISFLDGPLQAAQKSIITQISAKNTEVTTQQDISDSLWSALAKNFSLNYPITPQVQAQIDWYLQHPTALYQLANQATPYLYYIYQKLMAYQMPAEIALLPMIESNYNPFVSSSAGAGGLWQLMPNTAAGLGIRQNWWYDGRRDIVASTKAALDYLNYLQALFDGNWLLTFAAYNSGAGAVQQAINKNTQAGIPTGFWLLPLPKQTRNYVPRILALAAIIKEPEKYGIKLPLVKNEPYLETVDVGSQIELAEAAKLAGMDLATLYRLNPGYKHWATEPNGKHKLLLPIDVIDNFKAKLTQLPTEKRVKWDKYAVQPGDNLKQIAKNFNLKPELVKEINDLSSDFIEVGRVLRLPLGSRGLKYLPEPSYLKTTKWATSSKPAFTTPIQLAATKVASIKTQPIASKPTDVKPQPIKTELIKPVFIKAVSKPVGNKILHIVNTGETLWSVARNYKITRTLLCQWNDLHPDEQLFEGDQLVIYK